MKNLNKIWFLGLLALGVSCSSSKTIPYDAKWNAPFSFVDEVKIDHQDQQSRLGYGIINDDNFLYITLKTKDPNTIQKILGSGLRISFTPESQKKEGYYVQFPVVMKDDRKALKRIDTDLPNSLGLTMLLDSYNKEGVWKDQDGPHYLNLVEDKNFRMRISMDENNELSQQIIVPFSFMKINPATSPMLGINISVEGQSSGSGISPRIGIGLGGGIGMGGGVGVGIGTGSGYNNGYGNDRPVDIRLDVQLAKNTM